MKFVKGAFLYVLYPVMMLGMGFAAGVESVEFFYPGAYQKEDTGTAEISREEESGTEELSLSSAEENQGLLQPEEGAELQEGKGFLEEGQTGKFTEASEKETGRQYTAAKEVSAGEETLCVDTEYVLEEKDILEDTVVETSRRLPDEYVGLDREQFLAAMESYAAYPPLAELERGFVGLEVLSFSREKVVVQMNYQYLQPSSSFYLAVRGNEVVVYLEDRETIYIHTGIKLESLPEELQLDIMQMLWVEDEEGLYDFLEAYSS